jgi:urease accessory protein
MSSLAALLQLADGRLPSGGHVHSGGAESAVVDGQIGDVASLTAFLQLRLDTVGRVAAGLAAAACAGVDPRHLDALADARTPVPALRRASRAQGRSLLRVASAAWPSPRYAFLDARPHHAVALGSVAAVAGCTPLEAATLAATSTITGPAWAALRLLGLDPGSVQASLASLASAIDEVARDAATAFVDAGGDLLPGEHFRVDHLPADSSPALDLLAARHASRLDQGEVTLFAS